MSLIIFRIDILRNGSAISGLDKLFINFIFLGGCASFGHSCFGGHGKRSQQPDVRGQSFLDSSQELINQQYPQKSETVLEEQYSNTFDAKPNSDVRTLLKKLVRCFNTNLHGAK